MFKVAFIGQKGIPCAQGGIERYAEELSVRLAVKNSVTVYTRPYYTSPDLREYRNVRLVSLPTLKRKNLDAITHSLLATLHAVFFERVDIIHYQNIGPGFWAWLPRMLNPRIRVVGTFQSPDWKHEKWSSFARASLKLGAWIMCHCAHKTLVVSHEIREFAQKKYHKSFPFITNGVNVNQPLASETLQKELASFNLTPHSYIFSASRLIRHKGIHYLIRAFIHIKKQLALNAGAGIEDLKLVIAGDGFHTDDYMDELRQLSFGRRDILFTGKQQGATLQALFEGARIFVLPSEAEGLSLVLLEALAYGKVCVVSDIAPNIESITDPHTQARVALTFESKNVNALTRALIDALTGDYGHLKQRAMRHAQAYYNWDTIAEQVISLYTIAVHKQGGHVSSKFSESISSNSD